MNLLGDNNENKKGLTIFGDKPVPKPEPPYKNPIVSGVPGRPKPNNPYSNYATNKYVYNYAQAIRQDLGTYFDLLVGKDLAIWRINKDGHRCTECTDTITGNILNSNCPVCGGLGYTPPFLYVMDTKGLLQYNMKQTNATQTGTMETATDQLVIITDELIDDRDVIYMYDTGDIYLVDSIQPQITALMGEIITQILNVSRLSVGDRRYPIITKLNNERLEKIREEDERRARFEQI